MSAPVHGSSAELIRLASNVPEDHRHLFITAAIRESTREAVMECNDCYLGTTTQTRVPWEGPASPIFLLGEAPGANEESTGRPFVGRAGTLLDECIDAAGLKRSELAIGNTIGCRPPRNNYDIAKDHDAPARCRRHVEAAFSAAESWIVILMGGKAIEWLKGPGQSVSGNRGRFWWDHGILYGATFHPAYALRRGAVAKEAITSDLLRARQIRDAEAQAPRVRHFEDSSVDKLMPPAHVAQFRAAFRSKGWVVLHSKLIDSKLAVVKDHRVSVPEPWQDVPRYTLEEMNKLIPSPEWLRRVHVVKQIMDCEVL